MSNYLIIGLIVLFILILFMAIIKARKINPEKSGTEMHKSNFKKPEIENVEKRKR